MNQITAQIQSQARAIQLPASGILQRKCACGSHTVGGGKCTGCKEKEQRVQRQTDSTAKPHGHLIQRKLIVGASDDPLEKEADRVADQVMSISANAAIGSEPLRIQRFTDHGDGPLYEAPPSVDQVLSSSGRPLEPELRADMEQRFGHDFSTVRVHAGASAEESARCINAHAYTVGQNIVFGASRAAPGTHEGRRLIAHELAHVVQQSGSAEIDIKQGDKKRGLHPVSQSPDTSVMRQQRFAEHAEPISTLTSMAEDNRSECILRMSEVDNAGDSDDSTLLAINGKTGCNLPLGLPWLTVTNPRCTAPCTLLHESTHFADISPCCVRAGIAYRAASPADKVAVATRWNSWIRTNRPWFECRAYRVSQTCGTAISGMALCWAPSSVVAPLIVGGATIAGAVGGTLITGTAGAGAGAGAGLAGGPAAPVTVPVGATAGFITAGLQGFIAGAGIGALAGVGAEHLRRRCCNDLPQYRQMAAAKIAQYCGASAHTPCPF